MSSSARDNDPSESVLESEEVKVLEDYVAEYDIHNHSEISDGKKIYEMAKAARDAGLPVIAITDHEDYNFVEEDLEGYIEIIEEANEDINGIDILVGLEINYETNENDRYEIERRLAEKGLAEHPDLEDKYREDDIEQEKREKADKESIKVPYASVHDVDGTYVKREDYFLEKLQEDYLQEEWSSIDDIEEVDNEKIQRINEKVNIIKEAYADIYTDKVQSLAEEGEPFKFIAHPDLILRNSILQDEVTEEHIDRIIHSVKNSSLIPEANGKGVLRQFKGDIEDVINDPKKTSKDEVNEFRDIIKEEKGMRYFKKLGEEDIDYVTGSDSHRVGEIELRSFYFEMLAKSLENKPLTLEEVKKHIE